MERLYKAGAVLIGKLSMGALAMGGVWFAGTTKSPWPTEASRAKGEYDSRIERIVGGPRLVAGGKKV